MWSRLVCRRAIASLRNPSTTANKQIQRRTLVSAPKPGDGPLMERRPDRELPNIQTFRWARTLPVFLTLIAASSVAIFNYQKLSSPVVASTLYALRTSARAREVLGDEIYFRRQIPWIGGEMNQLRGRIDVRFDVKGSRGHARMRFASRRPSPRAAFETTEWSLQTPDGRLIDLLDGDDSFRPAPAFPMDDEEREEASRGYRQQLK
ncbi:DUF1783-domain-containing protein [Hypoxylon sp. FL1284]|nr:DUF1783-domain-containing protein [Hypoxylon sp. FL1284]